MGIGYILIPYKRTFVFVVGFVMILLFCGMSVAYDNYRVTSWGDDIITWGPGTDAALDSPQAIANMMAHWKGRGFTGVCWRPCVIGLAGADALYINDPNLTGYIMGWLVRSVIQANQTFDVLGIARTSAEAQGLKFWAWVPTVYSRGAPATGPGITLAYPVEEKYVHDHPEVLTIDRSGKKQYMVSEYAYPGARSSKVDDFKFLAQQCGVRNFIACLRTESFQIQAEPDKADQFGFNQPVVDAMQSLYGVNILTDSRFDVYSVSYNVHDPMVENWRILRGGYLTQFYRDLRAGLNSIDPNCKIAVWIPGGEYIGSTLGNWRLDWRTWVNEGLIDQLGLWFNLAFASDYTTRNYLTHYSDIGILPSSTFKQYIQSSNHPNTQLMTSRSAEFYPTDPGSDFNGRLTFGLWDSYYIAWYQRWQQWKKDLKDFGHIKFIEQDFDNFPVGTTGNGGGLGDFCYDPVLRSSQGMWHPIGAGTDGNPSIQNIIKHGSLGCAMKLAASPSPVLYCERKATYDRSRIYHIENNISNGNCTVEFWAYRRNNDSAVKILFLDGEAASDNSVGIDLRNNGVIYYLNNNAWALSSTTSSTNIWQKFTINIDVSNKRYSAFMGVNAETPVCVNALYDKTKNGFSAIAFMSGGGSVVYLDDISVKWVPQLYYMPKRRYTFIDEDFENQMVGATLNGCTPQSGNVWNTLPGSSQNQFLVENRLSFGDGVKCMSVQGNTSSVIASGQYAGVRLDPNYLAVADFDVWLRSGTVAKVALLKTHGGNPTAALYAHDGNWWYWNNGSYQNSGIAYEKEVWIRLQMVLNCVTKTYTMYVQTAGEMPKPLASAVAWDSGTNVNDVVYLEVSAPQASSNMTYFDNFVVTYGAPGCGDELHPYPVGDFSQDCKVNLFDLAIFAQNWLGNGPTGNMNNDQTVDMVDFATFAANWLADPYQSN